MNVREANVLLTKAALIDPRMRRVDATEQADRATAWAEVLAGVDLEPALRALQEHYRAETRPVMPADILRLRGDESEGWVIRGGKRSRPLV